MRSRKSSIKALSIFFLASALSFLPILSVAGPTPPIGSYSLNASPPFAQEGNTIILVLTVSGFTASTPITFSFRFNVRDPRGVTVQSKAVNYTTLPGQTEFSVLQTYPSTSLPGTNAIVGMYTAWVDELAPFAATQVATTTFTITLT